MANLDGQVDDGDVCVVERVEHVRLSKVEPLELDVVDVVAGAGEPDLLEGPLPVRKLLGEMVVDHAHHLHLLGDGGRAGRHHRPVGHRRLARVVAAAAEAVRLVVDVRGREDDDLGLVDDFARRGGRLLVRRRHLDS